MPDCKPTCCGMEQTTTTAQVGDHPIYDASSDCTRTGNFVPKDGITIPRGDVVFFTGNVVSLTIDGTARDYEEVDIADTGSGIAGIALWEIDNTNSDAGATQLLAAGRVFSNKINLNSATIRDMKAAGFDVAHVYK